MNYRQKIRVAHQLRHPFGAENETRARFAGILATSTLPPRRFAAVPSGDRGLSFSVSSAKQKKPTTRAGVYFGAENETRTRDPDLGKVVLYQLSYFRVKSRAW